MMKERSVSATREATGPLTWRQHECWINLNCCNTNLDVTFVSETSQVPRLTGEFPLHTITYFKLSRRREYRCWNKNNFKLSLKEFQRIWVFSLVTLIDELKGKYSIGELKAIKVHNDNESSLYSISELYSHEMSFSLWYQKYVTLGGKASTWQLK